MLITINDNHKTADAPRFPPNTVHILGVTQKRWMNYPTQWFCIYQHKELLRLRVYSEWTRRVKFDGYNFAGPNS